MTRHWRATCEGGWLVLHHRGRRRFAAALRVVESVDYTPAKHRWHPGWITVDCGERQHRYPGSETAAARLRRWWRDAQELRAEPPTPLDVRSLAARPWSFDGRRWVSRLTLGVDDTGDTMVLGALSPDPRVLHDALVGQIRHLSFEDAGAGVDALLAYTHPFADDGAWRFYPGVGVYLFDWDGPVAERSGDWQRAGVLRIETFQPDVVRVPEAAPHLRVISGGALLQA